MLLTKLPIFPLNTVFFPGELLQLRIFEPRYLDLISLCLKQQHEFGICYISQNQGNNEALGHKPLEHTKIGTLASIIDFWSEKSGVLVIKVKGGRRFQIQSQVMQANQVIMANLSLLAEQKQVQLPNDFKDCAALLTSLVAFPGLDIDQTNTAFDDAAWVSLRLSELLPIPLPEKQLLLEEPLALSRLEKLHKYIHRFR